MVFTQDTGQTQVMVPVLQGLAAWPDEFHLDIVGHRHAIAVWKDSGLRFRVAAEVMPIPVSLEAARAYLRATGPDLVVTGATHPRDVTGDRSNLNVLLAAKLERCPTTALLDHWQGLDRFVDASRDGGAYAPDYLGVMDEWVREQLAPTLPVTQIEVVGHPHLEQIWLRARDPGYSMRRAQCRQAHGVAADETVWIVVSQLLVDREDSSKRVSLLDTQIGSVDYAAWIASLAGEFQCRTGRRVRLVFRLHCKEPRRIVFDLPREDPLATAPTSEALMAADLLIGWDSMMLLEGRVAGVGVLCLQHQPRLYQRVDMERIGVGTWFEEVDGILHWLCAGAYEWQPPKVTDQLFPVINRSGSRAEGLFRTALASNFQSLPS